MIIHFYTQFQVQKYMFYKSLLMEGSVLAILINNYYFIILELYNKNLHYRGVAEKCNLVMQYW